MSDTDARIEAIQAARSRNNIHWMSLMKLAHRAAPEEAMAISDRINEVDEEILRLNGKLGTPKINNDHLVGIQARMSSTRLPGKVMMDICGKPMIHRVWDACEGPWRRVVLTSVDASDDLFCEYMDCNEIAYMRGNLQNVLSRYIAAIRAFRPKRMVRVCADAPLIRSEWIALALAERATVILKDALHAASQEEWMCASGMTAENREHAALPYFEVSATQISVAPKDYLMVNTREDLEEARRRWTTK